MTDEPQNDAPTVVASLEDDEGTYCVDILKHFDGHFTFAEYIRDEEGWHLTENEYTGVYATQYAAYLAAVKEVSWLIA